MNEKENVQKKSCEICEGSGQVCSFKGVSRFVLSWEDCPLCGGMGFIVSALEPEMEKMKVKYERETK
jgi:DnaJ-class molecular chaperone